MSTNTDASLYEIYDSLSPYEVAVLALTSPEAIAHVADPNPLVVITTKETYLWAGAVAHALVLNPNLELGKIRTVLQQAVLSYYTDENRFKDVAAPRYGRHNYDSPAQVVDRFLQLLNVADRTSVYQRTEAAVRSLVWRGYIEDPFKKNIAGAAVATLLLLPIGYTSTGPDNVQIDALTWQYVERSENNVHSRQLRVKIKEASEAVLHGLVPAAISAIEKLSRTSDGQGMGVRDVQIKLAQLGYYRGEIDDKVGPRTIEAIRQFQRDNYLEVTGYLDPATLQRLKSA